MEFFETHVFTRQITSLFSDDEYRELQFQLADRPESGALIRGGHGLRKVRFAAAGKGKSGGVRVIYYWIKSNHQIYMLTVYPKSKKDNLDARETAILAKLIKDI